MTGRQMLNALIVEAPIKKLIRLLTQVAVIWFCHKEAVVKDAPPPPQSPNETVCNRTIRKPMKRLLMTSIGIALTGAFRARCDPREYYR